MKKLIQFSAIVDGVTVKKDSTISLKLGLQELPPEDTAQIFHYGNKQIWVALAETSLTEADINIPEALTDIKGDKTKSQRQRDLLWVFWNKKQKGKIEWNTFYNQQMDKISDYIKEKLDD